MRWSSALACACLVLAGTARADDPLQLLFFGNSHTVQASSSDPTIPELITEIAVAAGHPAPLSRNLASNGKSLQWHLDNNTAGITTPPPPGEWDFVIMQDRAAGPTRVEGNLAEHISSSLSLYQQVAAHSPDVVPVMYETWARAYPSDFYTAPNNYFTGPSEMQAEVRDALHMSTDNINDTVGMDLARFAPVGDAWEETDFNITLYRASPFDSNHSSSLGKLLTSLVLYGVIYDDTTVSDIDLTSVKATIGYSDPRLQSRIDMVVGAADSVLAVPEPASATVALIGATGLLITWAVRSYRQRMAHQ